MGPQGKRDGKFPEGIRKAYTAVVTGNGRVLPIVETVGRRVLREIDPESMEGRRLLAQGRVELWSDGGGRARAESRQEGPWPPEGKILRKLSTPRPRDS